MYYYLLSMYVVIIYEKNVILLFWFVLYYHVASNRGSVPIPHTTIMIFAINMKCNKICCTYIGIHILKHESKPVITNQNMELLKTNLLLNFNQNVYFQKNLNLLTELVSRIIEFIIFYYI